MTKRGKEKKIDNSTKGICVNFDSICFYRGVAFLFFRLKQYNKMHKANEWLNFLFVKKYNNLLVTT